MIPIIAACSRLISVCLLLMCGVGCSGESSQDFEKNNSPVSLANYDSSVITPTPLPNASIVAQAQDAAPNPDDKAARSGGCRAQGIGDEETFARRVCVAARDFGFRAELVHSYGAGGVDIFISAADANALRENEAELRRQTAGLTEWAKRNYTEFNAVDVTIVGDSKIARGSKLGSRVTTIELFVN